jgi:hypothetical protein
MALNAFLVDLRRIRDGLDRFEEVQGTSVLPAIKRAIAALEKIAAERLEAEKKEIGPAAK